MAYAQWVSITIKARGTTLKVKNAQHNYGKFHECSNKDKEISVDTINTMTIVAGDTKSICACGREHAAAGTEGSFDLYDGDIKIGTYYWDCPWGSKTNISTWSANEEDLYVTQVTGGNLDSGALGNVTITCVKASAIKDAAAA